MMLKKYTELFHKHNLLDEAAGVTLEMLKIDTNMFKIARESLRDSDTAEMQEDIKKMDRKVNKQLRDVRRKILTHLTVAGTTNLVPGLVLASIVIDVERIGDYAKNIVGLARRHPKRLHGGKYEADMKKLEDAIVPNFERVAKALSEQDQSIGRTVMTAEHNISKLSEGILAELLTNPSEELSRQAVVSIALYVRFLKRINAHLTNVASAIVNPFPRISFREKTKS